MGSNICDISKASGTTIEGEFRVLRIKERLDQFARPFLVFSLVDATGQIPAYWWRQSATATLQDLDGVRLVGKARPFNGRVHIDVHVLTPLWTEFVDPENAVRLLPASLCPKRATLARLQDIVDAFHTPAMKAFINSVYSDLDIAIPFLSASASGDHHHRGPGGLLEHSVECAEWVLKIDEKPSWRRDIALAGALLHDVGKIQSSKLVVNGAPDRFLIEHDLRTLEILAPHLKRLERTWVDGAAALRYIWTWQHGHRRPQYPALIEADVVRAVDRWSAMGDVMDLAFSGVEEWRRFANFGVRGQDGRMRGPVQRCWRPRPPADASPG